jgi:serine/threonine-protein kinase
LHEILPEDVSCNDLLLHLCRRLIAPDPGRRYPSAEAADLERQGAADFHRQLVKGNLASEYENDLRVWLEQLG